MASTVPSAPASWVAYRHRVEALKAQYEAIPAGDPVRLAKRTSNLFRPRARSTRPGLDVAAFDGVIEVDPDARTADVQGMTTYEHLVDATLRHGLMPLVVPQLKTITLGGAITGLGIESSSWRSGMPHESMLELDILTGDGRILTATPDGEHADLFFGFPNSYGTLGYALRVKIELEPVRPFVHLRHVRFESIRDLVPVLSEVCESGAFHGETVAFVDGAVFGPDECYLVLGSWADTAPEVSDYTWTEIYYRSIQHRSEDWLTVRDYLWRWDTDWFWCSRAFGVQRPWVRRLLGPSRLRSDTYWKIMALEDRYHVKARIDRRRGLPERENVIQDIEVPVSRLAEFVEGFEREVPILPFWLCPLRARRPLPSSGGPAPEPPTWDLYTMDPSELYVNVGFWSSVALTPGMDPAHHNRWVEDEVERLGGRKSLYSTAFYDEERFWRLYNGPVYRKLKEAYDPGGRLLDLYAKCVAGR
ncbi:FAD-binding oxidoreductase [Acidiferrimicrobium sp. IK]|uniref:FAD-binding oxidoreductase n=1 Tax=Acidiferrimicrobium sp. IK TaxID=2871700 RepID=UPI0021CB3B26|nr:FAD-binding oxidoreductase [Acidiferrimicrobium sp. IK]MCU4186028.1 FAD-binding oxidoreductase [Acidiferrimicrobium sp. IK]